MHSAWTWAATFGGHPFAPSLASELAALDAEQTRAVTLEGVQHPHEIPFMQQAEAQFHLADVDIERASVDRHLGV